MEPRHPCRQRRAEESGAGEASSSGEWPEEASKFSARLMQRLLYQAAASAIEKICMHMPCGGPMDTPAMTAPLSRPAAYPSTAAVASSSSTLYPRFASVQESELVQQRDAQALLAMLLGHARSQRAWHAQ